MINGRFDLILTTKQIKVNQSLFPPLASAFSERYLGLPKPDTRAYTVRFYYLFFHFPSSFNNYQNNLLKCVFVDGKFSPQSVSVYG